MDELTPVEKHRDMWFKRDDYFKPFVDFEVCGGKVRQCMSLILENRKYIETECESTVATASSVHSPQAVIVARVAKEYGYKSIVGIGNTTVPKAISKHRTIQLASLLGAEIVVLSETQGFNNVLYSNLQKLKEERPFFEIHFGFQARTQKASIVGSIAEQVRNIPDEVTTLVVPMGSGITFCGILSGVIKFGLFDRKDFRLVGIQPFGYDKRKLISESVDEYSPLYGHRYDFYVGNYSYHTKFEYNVSPDFELDNIYESKAFHMMFRDNIVTDKERVCYWVIGNSNWLRVKPKGLDKFYK
tara:strand:- start:193 stop:1092 length:900 start_codon:yes stop_codon:yes gene_type:complete